MDEMFTPEEMYEMISGKKKKEDDVLSFIPESEKDDEDKEYESHFGNRSFMDAVDRMEEEKEEAPVPSAYDSNKLLSSFNRLMELRGVKNKSDTSDIMSPISSKMPDKEDFTYGLNNKAPSVSQAKDISNIVPSAFSQIPSKDDFTYEEKESTPPKFSVAETMKRFKLEHPELYPESERIKEESPAKPDASLINKYNIYREGALNDVRNAPEFEKEQDKRFVERMVGESKMANQNMPEWFHQKRALDALKVRREGGEFGSLKKAWDSLTAIDPERARKLREEEIAKIKAINIQREDAGLDPIPLPKQIAGDEIKQEPYKGVPFKMGMPFDFKKEAINAPLQSSMDDKSSFLKKEDTLKKEDRYKDLFTKELMREYPETSTVNVARTLSNEDLVSGFEEAIKESQTGGKPIRDTQKDAIINEYKKVAEEEGLDPNLFLGHGFTESKLVSGAKNKDSTASGTGQLTVAAYKDVQRDNPQFKDISFDELNKPENYKLQARAHAKYFKQMLRSAGGGEDGKPINTEMALRKYYQGGRPNSFYVERAKAGLDANGNPLVDKVDAEGNVISSVEDQQEELMRRGYDGPDADNYVKTVYSNRDMFANAGGDYSKISPRRLGGDSAEKVEALRRYKLFLASNDPSVLSEKDKAMIFDTGKNPFQDEQNALDEQKLLYLRDKYKEAQDSIKKNAPMPYLFGGSEESAKSGAMQEAAAKPAQGMIPSVSELESGKFPEPREVSPEQRAAEDINQKVKEQKSDLSSLLERLKQAESSAQRSVMMGSLGKALSQIGAGIAGIKYKSDIKTPDTPVFDEMIKGADRPLEALKRSIEIEKHDPNSPAAKSLRALLQSELDANQIKGVDLSGLSYNQMNELYTHISKQSYIKSKYAYEKDRKTEEKADKEITDFNNSLNKAVSSSRSALGKAASMVFQADRLFQLTGRDPSEFNKITEGQLLEIIGGMDSMINTQSTITGRQKLSDAMSSYRRELSKYASKFSNKPVPAKAADFIQQMYKTVLNERAVAEKELNEFFDKEETAISDKTKAIRSDKINQIKNKFAKMYMDSQIYDEHTEKGIANFMKINNIKDRDQAVEILKKQGLIKNKD